MNEIAAVDQQNGSVDERRLSRRQEQRYTGDVLRRHSCLVRACRSLTRCLDHALESLLRARTRAWRAVRAEGGVAAGG
ncbi:hypothetical protein ABT147_47100, partial [Streptomyces sp. NPDC001868]|uniref:hypothetical protein n=1 Tax=Streptomyces sp. NPDC001868 TaxID=3154401 RepID=UPI00331D5551